MYSNPAPNFCLMTGLNMSNFGSHVATRSANKVQSVWDSNYEDMISFLNGRGMKSGFDLSSQLLSSSTFGSAWHIGINANDQVEISSDAPFRIRYYSTTTIVSSSDVLGFGNTFIHYSGGATIGSPLLTYAATAPNEWIRGEIIAFAYEIEQVGGSGSFLFNFIGGAQDLIVACRVRGNGDIDDGSNTLEQADITAVSGSDTRWYVDNEGYVVNSSLSVAALTWNDTSFRDFLGFTGNETTTSINGYTVLKASNFCSSVLVPTRPYQAFHNGVENVSEFRRKISGGYTSNTIGNYTFNQLAFDLDARLDSIDLYQHFINKFIPLCAAGERINFYQVLGDSRRMLIEADANAEQPAHDLIYTSSRNGFEGRIRASMITSDYNLVFPRNMRRRVPISMRFESLNE